MKSTFIGEIFLEDFKGRQVLYILTETNWIISKTQSTIYRLQVLLLHLCSTSNVLPPSFLQSIQPPKRRVATRAAPCLGHFEPRSMSRPRRFKASKRGPSVGARDRRLSGWIKFEVQSWGGGGAGEGGEYPSLTNKTNKYFFFNTLKSLPSSFSSLMICNSVHGPCTGWQRVSI